MPEGWFEQEDPDIVAAIAAPGRLHHPSKPILRNRVTRHDRLALPAERLPDRH
jgi:hypothetical protein